VDKRDLRSQVCTREEKRREKEGKKEKGLFCLKCILLSSSLLKIYCQNPPQMGGEEGGKEREKHCFIKVNGCFSYHSAPG